MALLAVTSHFGTLFLAVAVLVSYCEGTREITAEISGSQTSTETDLQKHVSFFDKEKDGIISVSETFEGFQALKVGDALAAYASELTNGALGPLTSPENATEPRLSIYVANIHKGMHGSDTGTFDREGRFVPEKFNEIFTKHAKTRPDALSYAELEEMLVANREPKDYHGWMASSSGWKLLYHLTKDNDGFLNNNTVRDVYDGSLFYKMAEAGKGSPQKKA